MSLENDSLHFNCLFKIHYVDEFFYLSFVSDVNKDTNAVSKSAVLMPLFHRERFFDACMLNSANKGISIYVEREEDNGRSRSFNVFIKHVCSDSDILLHTIRIDRHTGVEWNKISFEKDIIAAFNSATMNFRSSHNLQVVTDAIKVSEISPEPKKLSNTKFGIGLLVCLALFFLIYKNIASPVKDSGNLNPAPSVVYPLDNSNVIPKQVQSPVQSSGAAPTSSNGESLTDYLRSAPSNAQVQKALTTSFQDADSVKQQVELNQQVLKNLNLPQGSDNDTGCFAGG